MNKIILIGNLGRDPEMSYTPNGKAVTKFSLAVTRRYSRSENGEKETDWFNIVAWNQLAENCNSLLKKGQKVYVEGRIEPRNYQDKTGANRVALDVTINEMELITPKNQQSGGSSSDFINDSDDGLGDLDDHPF
jgi:single-strand DNA-binding protein